MEKLKNITIIFLLAVGLLSPVASAKTTSVLLQEGLYAEEIEGDLDGAIKIYEQVIAKGKEAQQAAAQATYRIGMCFLKKGNKAKAADYFQQIVSNYQDAKGLVEKATEQLKKISPQHEDQLPWEAMVYIYDKHMEAHKKAKSKGIAVNSHIVGVDEDFVKYPGGILTHETSKKVTAGKEIWLGNFSKAGDVEFFNEQLEPQQIRFSKRETDAIGKYMLLWKADRDMEAGEVRVIAYKSRKTNKLTATDKGYQFQFNNHYGSPVLENFFLVVPLNVGIVEQSREYTTRKKFDMCEIYHWQKENPANTTNKVDVVLAKSETLIQDYAESIPVDELIKSGKVPSFKTQIYDNTGLDLDTGVSVPFMDEWPALCDVTWDNDEGGALMIKPKSSVRFIALGAAENWEDAISIARNSLAVLRISTSKGMFASESKFAAVLTNEGNLAVIQIGKYEAQKGTIYGWVEKIPAEVYCFGPVKVVTLNDVDHSTTKGKPCAISFATGRVSTIPRQPQMSDDDAIEWVRRRGIDAVAEITGTVSALIGVDLAAVTMPSEDWDTITPVELRTLQVPPSLRSQKTIQMSYYEGQDQPIYAFRTRKDQYGILQIIDVNKQKQEVRFRYKMLQQKLPDIQTLIKEMHNPDAPRFAALNKLIKIGQPAVERLITEMEKSNDWQIPKALGAIGDKRAVEPLLQKWQKCDWSPMKEVIAEALESITVKKIGQDKEKWDKWWQKTKRFISPEATLRNFMAAAMKLDMNNAMEYVASDSHDYKDTQEIFEESEHPFNVLFRKTDPAVPVKIIEAKIIDNMCEAVWQITFKEDFTIEGKTIKAGETFNIDGNLRRYGDKWLITGI